MKTKVVFLVNERPGEEDDLFAFFPDENYFHDSELTKMSYSHIGQHSACVVEYAKESRLATPEEYSELYDELTNLIEYDLEITDKY